MSKQKLIAKFINKISKMYNKMSTCLIIMILYYYLSDDNVSILLTKS